MIYYTNLYIFFIIWSTETMTVEDIRNTHLVKDNPNNTGLLSKKDISHPDNKYGLNPLFTILNQDFNSKLIKDDKNQRAIGKQIINMEYIKDYQKDIIRLYKEYYVEGYKEKLTEQLIEKGKPNLDFFKMGLDSITRSIPISLQDIEDYINRGGFTSFVFSHEARPEVIVFDFDIEVTQEQIDLIKTAFRGYIYLIEYKEENKHAHVYLKGTQEEVITYSNSNKEHLFTDHENNKVGIDVFKGSKRNTACTTSFNGYSIKVDETPCKAIKVKRAVYKLARCLGCDVNRRLLNELLGYNVGAVPQVDTPEDHTVDTTTTYNYYIDDITPPKETPQENKQKVIEEATPIFIALDKTHSRNTLYRAFTGALIKHGYSQNTIEEIVTTITSKTHDKENRLNEVRSCLKGQFKETPDHLYRWKRFEEIVEGRTEDMEVLEHLRELKNVIRDHDKKERTETLFYMENNINEREANLMKGYINVINDTLGQLKKLDEWFTDYFTGQLTHILRHSNLNNDTIKQILDPKEYSYNLYETLNKNVNEKTQIKRLVWQYEDSIKKQIETNINTKDKALTKQLTDKLNHFNRNEEDIYNIIQYNTDDIEEIFNISTANEEAENIQTCINKLLRLTGVIDIRLKTVLVNYGTKKISENTLVTLSKLINTKYDLFLVDTLKPTGKYQSTYYNTPIVYEEGKAVKKPYIEVNRTWLHNEFKQLIQTIPHYTPEDITLTVANCEKILTYVNKARVFDNNITELDNVYIKRDTMEIIYKEDTQETILTNDRLGLPETIGTHETIKLFSYDPQITIDKLTPDTTTDTVRIVKEILVPRQDQTDTNKFLYFIQLLGLMVHGNNDIKILPVFYREGNNGKGVLSIVIKRLFGAGASDIKPKRISDDFINEVIKRSRHALINDELERNTIKDNESEYKQLTGASGIGGRQIHAGEIDIIEEIPPLFLAGNYTPNIPVTNEFKAIIKRLNIIKMPNVFTDKPDPTLNEYEEISGTADIIKNDYQGLSQLLSLAINEFNKLDYKGNVRNQLALTPTEAETMDILSSGNPLLNFISMYTSLMELTTSQDKWITTKDIRDGFTVWYKHENKGIEPPEDLFGRNNVKIGYALQDVYGKKEADQRKQKPSNLNYNIYCYKLLTDDDKETHKKLLITVHEYDPKNEAHRQVNDHTLAVYNIIKNNDLKNEEEITAHLINNGYETEDIVGYLKTLDKVDLIEYKAQSTL